MTISPIRLMQNTETSPFNHIEPLDDRPRCKHGFVVEEDSRCWECENEKRAAESLTRKQKDLEKTAKDPTECLSRFGVPLKYINSTLETFNGNNALVTACREYKNGGLVLYGNTGCGKTHLSVSLMREQLLKNIKKEIGANDNFYKREEMEFITVPDLLLEIRSSFRDGAENTEESLINHYSEVDFLILDDLGSEKASEFAITTLYIIIDRRDRDMKSTVITTNLSPAEIENQLNARIASRMSGMKNIKINMPDYRKKR